MKNYLTIGAVAFATVASSFAADLTVVMTGSTAFRAATHAAIRDVLDNNSDLKAAYSNASGSKDGSDKSIFRGTVTGIGVVTVQCNWEGSAEGVDAAVVGFATTVIPATSLPASPGEVFSISATEAATATVGMSDIFPSSASSAAGVLRGYDDSQCDVIQTGVVPFQFVVNKTGRLAGITNITAQQVRLLFSNGVLTNPAGFGVTSAPYSGYGVYAVGRNAASGTRTTAFAETGYGIANPVNQYTATTSDSWATLATLSPVGNSGESSGGTMANFLKADSSSKSAMLIGYLGNPDTVTAVNGGNGGLALTYNGVANTDANIRSGLYTFWSYENLCVPANTVGSGSDLDLFVTDLVPSIDTNLASAGVALSTMACARTGDGALVGF